MKRAAAAFCISALLIASTGCSNKLSRREAKHLIDAMTTPHPVGSKQKVENGSDFGYWIDEDTLEDGGRSVDLSEHIGYNGDDRFSEFPKTSTGSHYWQRELVDLGYLQVQEEGPLDVPIPYEKILDARDWARYFHSHAKIRTETHWEHSYSIRIGKRVGFITKWGYPKSMYSSGFECSDEMCEVPPLIEASNEYEITGIVQDGVHAKVSILIAEKLSTIGSEVKNYEQSRGLHDGAAASFLNTHPASTKHPATILFQKFDDGWRIVDANGKSEKDIS